MTEKPIDTSQQMGLELVTRTKASENIVTTTSKIVYLADSKVRSVREQAIRRVKESAIFSLDGE